MALDSEPSVVPGILLSDLSIVEQGTQKRSIIGCFDRFTFAQFPATYPRFFVTVWVTNIQGVLKEIALTTRIEQKGSAHVVFSTSANLALEKERQFSREEIVAFSLGVQGLTFPTPGTYTVIILFGGDEVGKRDIMVVQTAKKTGEENI